MAETTEQYRTRINQLEASIISEPYMADMRSDISEGIGKTGNRQADIENRQKTIEDDFVAVQTDASNASPSGAELAVARGGFTTLDGRLTTKEQEVAVQLAQTMTQTEFDSWVATLLDGGPSIYMETYNALVTTYPDGADGVALVRESNPAYIYVWDGTIWKNYGEYQGLEIKAEEITNAKLSTASVTPDKLTDSVVIPKKNLPVYAYGGYVNAEGITVANSGWIAYEYDIPDSVKRIDINKGLDTALTNPVIMYNDNTNRVVSNVNMIGVINTHRGKLIINESKSTPNDYVSITVHHSKEEYLDEGQYNLIGSKTFYANGYYSGVSLTYAVGFSSYKINVKSNRKYKAFLSAGDGVKGNLYTSGGEIIESITLDQYKYVNVGDASYFIITIGPNDTLFSEHKETVPTTTVVYSHSVKKPYTFYGKRAYLFGDSIGEGYTGSVGGVTTNTFFSLFGNKVGFSSVSNSSKGGALFVPGLNETEDIPTSIQSKDLTTMDYVFIAGGTNDYGMGASLSDFKTALESLCVYLKANVMAEVIFITPINRQKPADVFVADLDVYRNILSEVVLKNGYSLINGKDFSFPEEYGEYQESVMPDGLHPSESGYAIYANDLTTVLC